MSGAPPPPLRLHIDRLVLDGLALDAAGAARFQTALTETLGTLFRRHGVPPGLAGGAVPRLAAPPAAAAASPEALGRAVAHSVHRGLTGRDTPR